MTSSQEPGRALCLRCDWIGSPAPACPRCAAPLFRAPESSATSPSAEPIHSPSSPDPSGEVNEAQPSTDPNPTFARSGRPEDEPFSEPAPKDLARRVGAIATAVATCVVIAAAFLWVRVHTPPVPTAASDLRGTLVYAVDEGAGWSRLWRWDLETGSVHRGPRVREPVELVNAFGAEPGLVGLTSRAEDGDLTGSLLRFLAPDESATPLVRGDLVNWGPRGATVVAVKRGPLIGPCLRHVAIVIKTIVPALEETQFDETFCGDVLSVGRDSNTTFMTLRHGDRVDLVFAGYGRTHPVLAGHALLSISPAADMLVVDAQALVPDPVSLVALRDRGDVPPTSIYGTALYFRGLGVQPRPYRSGPDRLWVDRVLTWSVDSTSALVVGRLGEMPGVYEITAGPQRRIDPPRLVMDPSGPIWATAASDDVSFVLADGGFSIVREGAVRPLPLPPGAPAPDGPLVWLA
jgi:hypothetical protein